MKQYAICGIGTLFLALCCMIPAGALEVSAHSAILMDGDTGAVLYEKAADQRALIASTTKIMTAMVVLEQDNLYLDETVEIPREAAGIEGSSMYLKAGETVTVRALLYGMMLSSGNDAAAALALHTYGSIEAFAARMNEKARALGLRDTHFANPNGLDSEENYSTARELGKIAMAALDTPGFREIVSARSYTAGNRQLVNHNKLLWQYPGAIGVKTGFTKRAGRILVGAAEQNGRTLISVTISDPEDWRDHRAMLDYGFGLYRQRQVVAPGQVLGLLTVMEQGGWHREEVMAEEAVTLYLRQDESPEIRMYLPMFRYGPLEPGEPLGTGEVYVDGVKMAETAGFCP